MAILVNEHLVTGAELKTLADQGRIATKAAIPNTDAAMDGETIYNTVWQTIFTAAEGKRCIPWISMLAQTSTVSIKYGTTIAAANAATASNRYIKYNDTPRIGAVLFTATDILRTTAVAPVGYYIYSGLAYYISGSDGRITSSSITNISMRFTNNASAGSSAKAVFGALWDTGFRTAGSGTITLGTSTTGPVTISVTRSTGGVAATANLLKNGAVNQSKAAPINATTTFASVTFALGEIWEVTIS